LPCRPIIQIGVSYFWIRMNTPLTKRIAVIGSGAAGITAAHMLQKIANVKLFEKNSRLGGHTNTVVIEDGPDAGTPVDTGFIVLNDRTYPLLHTLLDQLNCPVRFSDMSFGYSSEKTGFYYAGTGLAGLFAQKRNFFRPAHYRFLGEIISFGKKATRDLDQGNVGDVSLSEYTRNLRPETLKNYIIPMAAAIWSASQDDILLFPAKTLLEFWRNHGLLSLQDRPRWQTVVGGSHAYLKAFKRSFCGQIALNSSIRAIRRTPDGVTLIHQDGYHEEFDDVVIATHADEALPLLEAPTPDETTLLGVWKYQHNRTVLHTDTTFLPSNRKAWASWNYIERKNDQAYSPVPVTYYMNLLQGLKTHDDYCVTLNPDRDPARGTLIRDIAYHHPVYSREAVASQARLPSLQGNLHTWYCGSYFGYGFHEDAVRSGVEIAIQLGVGL